ncbi:MAG: pyruvate kinase [Candidatus Aureabacteria bacterium]|nr:pyruvate kinase [Candidatus Auribacterota bacterium]
MKKNNPLRTADEPSFVSDLNHNYLYFRRTKIVATIGPASNSNRMLEKLIGAGLNVARINFSHGDPKELSSLMERIRSVARRMNKTVAILADLCGPKIRVGMFKGDSIVLKDKSIVTVTIDPVIGEGTVIPSQYKGLVKDVHIGQKILLDDGNLELKVVRKRERSVEALVVQGGILKNKKGMNLPDSKLSVSALTPKDRSDLVWAVKGGADYIALSFVRTAQDIITLRHLLKSMKSDVSVIAKIEMPEALENIHAIVDLSDGIMVARGDLGVELPARKVPIIQNKLIQLANKANKPVIVATQMLESMIEHSRPTRAEVTDVASACLAGSDAVMLSAETASGKFPVEALSTMDEVLREAEAYQFFALNGKFTRAGMDENNQLYEALGTAIAQLSRDLQARAVFVHTASGYTARIVSADRPAAPILALTQSESVRRKLNLFWGVHPYPAKPGDDVNQCMKQGSEIITRLKLAKSGDYVLALAGLSERKIETASLLVRKIG